jgi:hypothetical protein
MHCIPFVRADTAAHRRHIAVLASTVEAAGVFKPWSSAAGKLSELKRREPTPACCMKDILVQGHNVDNRRQMDQINNQFQGAV